MIPRGEEGKIPSLHSRINHSIHLHLYDQTFKDKTIFPFKLDDFQQSAIAALAAGKSVVVCAPTGSGKTLIN